MKIAGKRIALLIGILVGVMVVYGCTGSSAPPTPTTIPPVPTTAPLAPTTYVVTLFCQDCADVGMEIRIWTSPDRSGVAGSVPHNTLATVIDTTTYNGVLHYKVQIDGITGWVSHQFVQE